MHMELRECSGELTFRLSPRNAGQSRCMFFTLCSWHRVRYSNAWSIVEEGDKVTGKELLSEHELQWLYGKSFERLFLK